jgi:hypothetical protein
MLRLGRGHLRSVLLGSGLARRRMLRPQLHRQLRVLLLGQLSRLQVAGLKLLLAELPGGQVLQGVGGSSGRGRGHIVQQGVPHA